MKHFQPFVAGQRLGSHAEGFEVVEDVGFNAFELRLCCAEGVRLNAEGDVLLLDQPVVALGELVLQHSGILGADVVEGEDQEIVRQNRRLHDPESPFLIGGIREGDKICDAKQEPYLDGQMRLALYCS